jgi:uncharacterized protein YjbI with pentapeptide repeats
MNTEELNIILEKHKKWLKGDSDGDGVRADLCGADLRWADLCYADLRRADLRRADLRRADLRRADLRRADLREADLRRADLRRADLRRADLRRANYEGTILNLQCPEEGEFVGWKKCKDEKIVKLLIPADAKRSSATSRKCRCSKAIVLGIFAKNENIFPTNYAISDHDPDFIYRKGETVEVKNFDDERWNECSAGIHFFITRKEAEEYC